MKKHIKLYEEYTTPKSSQFFKTYEEVEQWLNDMGIKDYDIDDDLDVDVDGDVYLFEKGLEYLPVQFSKVEAHFNIARNQLTTLKGCPYYVQGDFEAGLNQFKNLKHFPKMIWGHANIGACSLESIEGIGRVDEWIGLHNNRITSLVFYSEEMFRDENRKIYLEDNPCEEIYEKYGFTTEAHIKCLLEVDPNPKKTMERLKLVYPDRYQQFIKFSRELSIKIGLEDEELTKVYNTVSDIEKGYF